MWLFSLKLCVIPRNFDHAILRYLYGTIRHYGSTLCVSHFGAHNIDYFKIFSAIHLPLSLPIDSTLTRHSLPLTPPKVISAFPYVCRLDSTTNALETLAILSFNYYDFIRWMNEVGRAWVRLACFSFDKSSLTGDDLPLPVNDVMSRILHNVIYKCLCLDAAHFIMILYWRLESLDITPLTWLI